VLNAPHPGIIPVGFGSEPLVWIIYVRDFWEKAGVLGRTTEVQQLLVESALVRCDTISATQMLIDWQLLQAPHTRISKYVPGDHYYVLDTKFDSYAEAADHARRHGFFSTSLHTVNVDGYQRRGD
jgi:hypothetical protein